MNRRKVLPILAAFLLGILIARSRTWYALAACLLCLVSGILWSCRKKEVMLSILIAVSFGTGIIRYNQEINFRNSYEVLIQDNQEISLQGRLYKKEEKSGRHAVYLKNCVLQIDQKNYLCNSILAYIDAGEYHIGETITAKAKIKTWKEARNDGNFDEKAYYQSQKIDFRADIQAVTGVYGRKDVFGEALYTLKQNLMKTFAEHLKEREAGVMDTIVLGEKSALDAEVKELYQDAGISHILAISGLHISIIGMSCFKRLRKLNCSYLFAALISVALLYSFGRMSGMGISTKRAVGMFLLLMVANVIGRSYDSLCALGCVGCILLFKNPFLIENSSFLFSFGAVFGAGMYQENTNLTGWKNTVAMSFTIQLVTMPLLAYFYHTVAVYTILANLLVLPIVGILLMFGILGGIAGILAPALAPVLLFPCHLILLFYEKVCKITGMLPGGTQILGAQSGIRLAVYLLCLVLWLSIMQSVEGRKGSTCIKILLPVLMLGIVFFPQRQAFEIDILDVGQGDGIYLQTEEGIHMFIDGGSTDVSKVGTYRILPFLQYHGVRHMEYWFVTHLDEDHCSGLMELLEEGYPIDNIVLSSGVYQDEAFFEFRKKAKKYSNLVYMKKGDTLKIGDVKLTCLFPDGAYDLADRNAKSLVLYLEKENFKALFTGDIGEEQEERLLSMWKGKKLSLYKAAHHGSRYSNGEEILAKTQPEISVISCGYYNRYGHPGKETIERMKQVNSKIYYTMYSGQLKITVKKGKTIVEKKLKE